MLDGFCLYLSFVYTKVNHELFALWNIKHVVTSAYHPQSNGQVNLAVCY